MGATRRTVGVGDQGDGSAAGCGENGAPSLSRCYLSRALGKREFSEIELELAGCVCGSQALKVLPQAGPSRRQRRVARPAPAPPPDLPRPMRLWTWVNR